MRPSLASRIVCRRLLVFQGLSSPSSVSALSGLRHASSPRSTRPLRPLVYPSSRRTFLDFFKSKPPRDIKHVGYEPGFEVFLRFHANTLNKVKLPSDEELVRAFRAFFAHKKALKKAVNPTQALLIRKAVEYLQSPKPKSDDSPKGGETKLLSEDFTHALSLLGIKHRSASSQDVAELASLLYSELEAAQISSKNDHNDGDQLAMFNEALSRYVEILTHHNQTLKAADLVSKLQSAVDAKANSPRNTKLHDLHRMVIQGYGREANYYRMNAYAQMVCNAGIVPYTPKLQQIMTGAYYSMGEDGERELREWFERPVADGKLSHPKSYLHLVNFASRTGRQPDWINAALEQLCDMNPPKRWWDVIFAWAVHQGKDINHIRNMVEVLAEVNPGDERARIDITTINFMLEAALAKKQPFLAERINSMAFELGLRPDERTHMALLQARIAGQDDSGAASVFDEIIHSGPFLSESILSQAANLYIRFACTNSKSANIVEAVSRFEARRGELEPETVLDVCMKFLRDDQTMEVIDTLGIHLNQFSMDERRLIRVEFVQYCLDMSISTARAWDSYSLLRQYWPETPKEERTKLMQAFFSRKRPDMACHVFGHMRAHPDDSYRPEVDHYVLCLENLGLYPDLDSAEMIHNMLKMDARIQPSTQLYNAFIIAFTGCGSPRKAWEFWRQVSSSKDGPTYKSLELAFRACERMPYGYERAKAIWDKMANLEVDVPVHVYDAFILMLAGQMRLDEAKRMLPQRFAEYDEEPSQLL